MLTSHLDRLSICSRRLDHCRVASIRCPQSRTPADHDVNRVYPRPTHPLTLPPSQPVRRSLSPLRLDLAGAWSRPLGLLPHEPRQASPDRLLEEVFHACAQGRGIQPLLKVYITLLEESEDGRDGECEGEERAKGGGGCIVLHL